MSVITSSKLGNFIRGGQTTIHFIRMTGQVAKQFVFASLISALLCYCFIFYMTITKQEQQTIFDYSWAYSMSEIFKDKEAVINVTTHNGKVIKVTAISVITNPNVLLQIAEVKNKANLALYYSLIILFFILLSLTHIIYKTGKGHKADEHIRGGLLVNLETLKKRLKNWMVKNKESQGTFDLTDLTLPKRFEPAHILVAGDTGTGKSNLLRKSLTSIRKAKQRVIIYDRSGDFVKNFYRSGIDVILNPMDERSAQWDIFKECRKEHEFHQLVNSFIPDVKSSDPFWTKAARLIFSSMLIIEAKNAQPNIKNFVDKILHLSIDDLIHHCEGTDAQAIVTRGGEKMAISVRAVLVSYVQALKYLPTVSNDPFSVKEWVKNDEGDGWIFLTSNKEIHDIIKPLITSWLDIATSSILSLEPNEDRRIWIFVDELPTLNKLHSIQDTPAESRKYGGCFVLGFQNYPQLLDIYGKNGADALCGSCSTTVIFRCNEPSFASWAARQLGKAEMIETTEGISYGVNEIRDGVNLGKQKHIREIVLPTELQNLPDLHGYLKLGRGFPVAKFSSKYIQYEKIAEGYIEKDDSSVSVKYSSSTVNPEKEVTRDYIDSFYASTKTQAVDSALALTLTSASTSIKRSNKDKWSVNTSIKRSRELEQDNHPNANITKNLEEDKIENLDSSNKPIKSSGFIRTKKKRKNASDGDDTSSDRALKEQLSKEQSSKELALNEHAEDISRVNQNSDPIDREF